MVDVLSLKTFKAEWGSQQADLAKDVPTHFRGVGTGWCLGPFQTKPFYDNP